jgi:dTDP-glucose 4,6-dehydratase
MVVPGTAGEVFNLGNPDEYTVLEFARIIAERVGSDAGIAHRPLPEDDPTRRRPDITKARSRLGWEPRTDLSTGIDRTVHWFRDLLSLPSASSGR